MQFKLGRDGLILLAIGGVVAFMVGNKPTTGTTATMAAKPAAFVPDWKMEADHMNPSQSADGTRYFAPKWHEPIRETHLVNGKWAYKPPPPPPPPEPVREFTMEPKLSWHLGGFGTVVVIDAITFKNTTLADRRDITIRCTTYGASNTALSRFAHTIYDVVPAGKTKTFRNINGSFVNSQSASMSCTLATP